MPRVSHFRPSVIWLSDLLRTESGRRLSIGSKTFAEVLSSDPAGRQTQGSVLDIGLTARESAGHGHWDRLSVCRLTESTEGYRWHRPGTMGSPQVDREAVGKAVLPFLRSPPPSCGLAMRASLEIPDSGIGPAIRWRGRTAARAG
ncbi:MAG: hypothetical protein OXC19_24120 [Bryobacterales bacterium]|nr:hypothetical protein [Bryobacterales bacterium]